MHERLQQNSLTIAQLSLIRDEPWTKIVRYLAPFKDQLDVENFPENIQEIVVPREIYINFDFIKETNQTAEDWLTTTAAARELEVEYTWVNRRILFLNAPAEFRVCSNGSRLHLHPDAMDELENIRRRSIINIDEEKYMNLAQISEAVGRHRLWVTNRLDSIDVDNLLGLDATRKSVVFYDIAVLPYLLEERDKFANATGEEFTIPKIAELTGKDREWVESQIEELGIEPQLRRFEKSGRVDICFLPNDLEEVFEIAETYRTPPEGWFTENAIVRITDRSANWVRARVKRFEEDGQYFADSTGALRKHYPPEVIDKIVAAAEGWNLSIAIKDKDTEEDKAGKFVQIFELCGTTISQNSLLSLGTSEEEIKQWMDYGLITRWSNGQYYFTKLAGRVVERVRQTENAVKLLRNLEYWLD